MRPDPFDTSWTVRAEAEPENHLCVTNTSQCLLGRDESPCGQPQRYQFATAIQGH